MAELTYMCMTDQCQLTITSVPAYGAGHCPECFDITEVDMVGGGHLVIL